MTVGMCSGCWEEGFVAVSNYARSAPPPPHTLHLQGVWGVLSSGYLSSFHT